MHICWAIFQSKRVLYIINDAKVAKIFRALSKFTFGSVAEVPKLRIPE
jgi:hypothetical protein